MAVNYSPVRPGLERARMARAERGEEVIRRPFAELSELHLAQRTIGVKRLQRRISHENLESEDSAIRFGCRTRVRSISVEPSLHSSLRHRMAYGAAFDNSLLAARYAFQDTHTLLQTLVGINVHEIRHRPSVQLSASVTCVA
jgi:hypothetical protein